MPKRKKKATSAELFLNWWDKKAKKRVLKIEKEWIKNNEPNDPEDEDGGDHWNVNQMMHDGDAYNATIEIAEDVFMLGQKGENWEMDMSYSLFCDLDEVIRDAYLAGKEMVS